MPGEASRASFSCLLAAARRHDRAAIGELCARYEPVGRARARRRLPAFLRRRFDIEDISQTVLLNLLQKLPEFEDCGEAAFLQWIRVVVDGTVHMSLRRALDARGRARETPLAALDAELLRANSPSPLEHLQIAERRAWLSVRLRRLSDADRRVVLSRARGFSYAAIARLLRLPSGDAARMRHRRALQTLRPSDSGESESR